jgi:hypothetical protein
MPRGHPPGTDEFLDVISPVDSILEGQQGEGSHIIRMVAALTMLMQQWLHMLVESDDPSIQNRLAGARDGATDSPGVSRVHGATGQHLVKAALQVLHGRSRKAGGPVGVLVIDRADVADNLLFVDNEGLRGNCGAKMVGDD